MAERKFILPWDSGIAPGLEVVFTTGTKGAKIEFKSLNKEEEVKEDQEITLTIKTLFVNLLSSVKRPKIKLKVIKQANIPAILVDSKWDSPVSSSWKFIITD